jgi:acetyl-CoA acetyltransferase
VVLRSAGIGAIPVVNVENACASASTALHQASVMISAGVYDVVLALGVEKLYHPDKKRSFAAIGSAVDTEEIAKIMEMLKQSAAAQGAEKASSGAGEKRSMFMDFYAAAARRHMEKYGTTARQFAAVAAKNSYHGSLNPKAQFQEGWDHGPDEEGVTERCVKEAYETAGVGPDDLDLIECHDASAPAELIYYEEFGLCKVGEGGALVESGATKIGGRIPVNSSGGLLRKGHPVGATGLAQLTELVEQLRGQGGPRQVEGARVGMAHNGGGTIGTDAAAMCVTIVSS